jgi:hypothetical protein
MVIFIIIANQRQSRKYIYYYNIIAIALYRFEETQIRRLEPVASIPIKASYIGATCGLLTKSMHINMNKVSITDLESQCLQLQYFTEF